MRWSWTRRATEAIFPQPPSRTGCRLIWMLQHWTMNRAVRRRGQRFGERSGLWNRAPSDRYLCPAEGNDTVGWRACRHASAGPPWHQGVSASFEWAMTER